jgi:hypothetical protein
MPALFPIILTATQIVLVADPVPKFDVEGTCRAAAVSGLPGRDSAACQRDEQGARSMLQKDWTEYRAKPLHGVSLDRRGSKLRGIADLPRNGEAD